MGRTKALSGGTLRHPTRHSTMIASPTERTPLKFPSTDGTSDRLTCSITRNAKVAGGVFAAAGIISLCGYGFTASRAPDLGLDAVGHLGNDPNHDAIAMDMKVGPLNPHRRNAARLGISQSSLPTPACFADCALEGLDLAPDSSFCYGLESNDITSCYDSCDDAAKAQYDAFVDDLCPDGTGYDVSGIAHAGPFDSDVPEGDDSDITSDAEVLPTTLISERDKYGDATLGRFQAGPQHIAEDAKLSLTTWECDFDACGAQHPTPQGGVGQYVDESCGYLGGVGCEGALGGETQCRACYLVEKDEMDFDGNLGYPRCPMCLCKEFDFPVEKCILCSGFYKYFKFEVVAVRGGWGGNPTASNGGGMQFAELILYDNSGDAIPIDVASSTNPGGYSPVNGYAGQTPYHQGPGAAVDGVMEQKFFDARFTSNGRSSLIFAVQGDPVMIRGYEFFTAEDAPSRDPNEWTLSGADSPDGPWYTFSHISNAEAPTQRLGSYGVFDPCVGN